MASSSPNRSTKHNDPKRPLKLLRAIVINFQSIKNEANNTQVLIDNAHPDITLGTATWLNGNISSAEVVPTNFQVFRNDAPTHMEECSSHYLLTCAHQSEDRVDKR